MHRPRARLDPRACGRLGHGLEGSLLLAVYALGLAVPFLIAAALFVPAMGVFRRVRDHYVAIQFVSGTILVALGALLFAGEFWRLRVYLNRLFEALGLALGALAAREQSALRGLRAVGIRVADADLAL